MKNTLLFSFSIVITLTISLFILKWLAPGLIGVPVDLQLVKSSKEVPPFYEGVFRQEDRLSGKMILQDPVTVTRNQPLRDGVDGLGPHDLLGFRNREIKNMVDILILGDSQTYGNNAFQQDNWPSYMSRRLGNEFDSYSMATGGWSAPQYLSMFHKGIRFNPGVVIVAIYTGNDALEAFRTVYGVEKWNELIPDVTLSSDDLPKVQFPPPAEDMTEVVFNDKAKTIFTPKLRYYSNDRSDPVVKAGYEIIKKVIGEISTESKLLNIVPIFTIIPTKELVYNKKIKQQDVSVSAVYNKLVIDEKKNIQELVEYIDKVEGAYYVDVMDSLSDEAMVSQGVYPDGANGHPLKRGYEVIGNRIADVVMKHVSRRDLSDRLIGIEKGNGVSIYLLRDGVLYLFDTMETIQANGWTEIKLHIIDERTLKLLPVRMVDSVDPVLYGPLKKEQGVH